MLRGFDGRAVIEEPTGRPEGDVSDSSEVNSPPETKRAPSRYLLAAGVADSMVASLATFLVGIYATRRLDLDELGAYGLLFAASLMIVSGLMAQLYLTPAEVLLHESEPRTQLASLPASTIRGWLLAAPLSIAAGLLVWVILGTEVATGLVVTAVVMGVLSPNQDHVRRVLHQSYRSFVALLVSFIQLVVVSGVLGIAILADWPPTWVAFGALATANLVSTLAGLAMARIIGAGARKVRVALGEIVRFGRWLVVAFQTEQWAAFLALSILSWIAGTEALGEYEAARIVTQPIMVAAFGLQSVLRAPAMDAAMRGDGSAARRPTLTYLSVLAALGIGWAVVAGIEWPGNPLPDLFPNAYAQTGLVSALALSTVLLHAPPIFSLQILAARQERALLRLHLPNAPIEPTIALLLSTPLGSLMMPVAIAVERIVLFVRLRPVMRTIYPTRNP